MEKGLEETKEMLERYRSLWADIEIKQQEIEELKSRAEKITATISFAPSSGRKSNNADYTLVIERIDELKAKLEGQIKDAIQERKVIEKLIESVRSPIHRRVLIRRYINGDTFERIAVDENRSYKHIINRIHPEALEIIKRELMSANVLE